MSTQIKAPFTAEQVEGLNRWQRSTWVHPFTCGNRDTPEHETMDPECDWGVLVATADGWVCRHCSYTQDWAHDYMVDPPLNPFAAFDNTTAAPPPNTTAAPPQNTTAAP